MEEVKEFIKKCGVYYLATMDGDKPRVRPFGTIEIFEGKHYIQTGKSKDVSKQIQKNGNVEISATAPTGDSWIRVAGTLVRDDRREPKVNMLEHYPELKSMYSPDDDNTEVLYFKDATATIYSFTAAPKVIKF
ncbi:MAG: pyridoxamine 5'-phosphate oxidase family protein [Fibrobacter sp.]|nr:pyridoxamine 5'-phosphate oxidase family protein [Fibrobacter sp.]